MKSTKEFNPIEIGDTIILGKGDYYPNVTPIPLGSCLLEVNEPEVKEKAMGVLVFLPQDIKRYYIPITDNPETMQQAIRLLLANDHELILHDSNECRDYCNEMAVETLPNVWKNSPARMIMHINDKCPGINKKRDRKIEPYKSRLQQFNFDIGVYKEPHLGNNSYKTQEGWALMSIYPAGKSLSLLRTYFTPAEMDFVTMLQPAGLC